MFGPGAYTRRGVCVFTLVRSLHLIRREEQQTTPDDNYCVHAVLSGSMDYIVDLHLNH